MTNKKFAETDEAIQLRNRIDHWRKNKTSRKMPEALWAEAVSHAENYSPTAVAKFLGIGHADLIKRIPQYVGQKRQDKQSPSHGFIELASFNEIQADRRMEVQLMNSAGQSATIRHGGSAIDWENLFTGWFRASHSIEKGSQP